MCKFEAVSWPVKYCYYQAWTVTKHYCCYSDTLTEFELRVHVISSI